jgi:hypothetical protein
MLLPLYLDLQTGSGGTVALTGVSATGAVGTLTPMSPDITLALTGVTSTGSIGSLTPGESLALANALATGAIGSMTVSESIQMGGVIGIASLGIIGNQPVNPVVTPTQSLDGAAFFIVKDKKKFGVAVVSGSINVDRLSTRLITTHIKRFVSLPRVEIPVSMEKSVRMHVGTFKAEFRIVECIGVIDPYFISKVNVFDRDMDDFVKYLETA